MDKNSKLKTGTKALTPAKLKAIRAKTIPWDFGSIFQNQGGYRRLPGGSAGNRRSCSADPCARHHRALQGHGADCRAAGLGRESLYKALSANGNPEFATVLKVIHALGLKLKVAA